MLGLLFYHRCALKKNFLILLKRGRVPVSKHPIVHRSLSVFKAGQQAQSETKMFLPLICSLWLFATSSSGIEYSNNLLCKDENYEVHWRFENNTETFYFKVRAKATGWIGFGVSRLLWPENETLRWNMYSMRHYDVLVGGVDDSGKKYFKVSVYLRLFLSSQCPSHVLLIPENRLQSQRYLRERFHC